MPSGVASTIRFSGSTGSIRIVRSSTLSLRRRVMLKSFFVRSRDESGRVDNGPRWIARYHQRPLAELLRCVSAGCRRRNRSLTPLFNRCMIYCVKIGRCSLSHCTISTITHLAARLITVLTDLGLHTSVAYSNALRTRERQRIWRHIDLTISMMRRFARPKSSHQGDTNAKFTLD